MLRAVALAMSLAATDGGLEPLIEAKQHISDLVVDLRYATPNNFMKRQVYASGARCLLLPSTAEKLSKAAATLRAQRLRVKVYDCYRPLAVQHEMWKLFPVPGYVADPKTGSNHNRGAAVDLTLVNEAGLELEMPTPFDTFSPRSHHRYAGGTEASRKNRRILREAMESAGFIPNPMEWWHYELPAASRLPVRDEPF